MGIANTDSAYKPTEDLLSLGLRYTFTTGGNVVTSDNNQVPQVTNQQTPDRSDSFNVNAY